MDADPDFVKDIEARAVQGDEACSRAATCLQALRSVICSNHCAVSAAAYFAGTVAALQRHLQQKPPPPDAEATAAALLLVLRKALPAVSTAVAQARLADVVAALGVVLKWESEELVRLALGCLAAAAESAYDTGDKDGEGGRPNRKLLKPLFALIGDLRPAVRQRAQAVATSVLRRAATANDLQTLDFASQHLVQMISSARPDKQLLDDIPARHAVALLRSAAPLLPLEQLVRACHALLELPARLGQHPVTTEALEFLASHLGAEELGELNRSPAEQEALATVVVQKLLAVKLSLLNVSYVVAYAQALGAAAAVLSGARGKSGAMGDGGALESAAISQLLGLFAERDPSVLQGVHDSVLRVLVAAGEGGDLALLDEMPERCRPLLRYECKGSWPQVLLVIAGVFDAVDTMRLRCDPAEVAAWTRARFERARGLLSDLVGIRDKAHGGELNVFGKELDKCLGSLVSSMGADLVLQAVELRLLETPLNTKNYEQLSRSWLLLVLRDSCRRTSLTFFQQAMLPVATALKRKSVEATATSPVEAKKYETLLEHLWALVPGFADEPLDLSTALMADGGRLAKQLVSVLQNEAQFKDSVWLAFSRLARTALEPPSRLSEARRSANTQCLQTLSSRVMPEMFSAYVKWQGLSASEGQDSSLANHSRHLALEAIQDLAKLAAPSLLESLFKNVVQRLLKATAGQAEAAADETLRTAGPLADLANTLVPLLPAELLDLVLRVFTPMLNGSSEAERALVATLQKAAYRAVRSVVCHAATQDEKLVPAAKILEFWGTLRDCRETCEPGAIKVRLAAMVSLLELMERRFAPHFGEAEVKQAFLQCVTTLMPEVLQHLRHQSGAVREMARECLQVAATTAIQQELQTEVVTMLSSGLMSLTPHSKAAAVVALSRLTYEHSSKLSPALLDQLVRVVLNTLVDPDAQVFRAAVKFAKVVVFVMPKESLVEYLPQILRLFEHSNMMSVKMLTRHIVERLVKVLPAESLAEGFPQAHRPLLQYVQRQLARKQRPRTILAAGGDEDAEMEDADERPSWAAFEAASGGAFDADAEIVGSAGRATKRKRAAARSAAAAAAGAAPRGSVEPVTSPVMAHESVQALLDAWEAESDGEGGGGGRKRKHDSAAATTWIHEDREAPLDFMSADAAHSVLTTRPAQQKRQRGGEGGAVGKAETLRRHGLRFAEDGRLVVDEAVERAAAEKEGGDDEPKFAVGEDTTGARKKLKPLSRLAAIREARVQARARVKLEKGGHLIKGLDNYRPGTKSRGQGDARRPGTKLEPYAYVRLNPRIAKEKFKKRAIQSFAKVIKGAKQGVLKGKKAKARDQKIRAFKEAQKRKRHSNSARSRPAKQR